VRIKSKNLVLMLVMPRVAMIAPADGAAPPANIGIVTTITTLASSVVKPRKLSRIPLTTLDLMMIPSSPNPLRILQIT
jgi:hypothetical protein